MKIFGALAAAISRLFQGYQNSGQQLLGVISDVLEMSRLEAGRVQLQKGDVEIGTVVSAALRGIEEAAREKSIALTSLTATSIRLMPIPLRSNGSSQVLLHNAVKFTPERGSVNIRARQVKVPSTFMSKTMAWALRQRLWHGSDGRSNNGTRRSPMA